MSPPPPPPSVTEPLKGPVGIGLMLRSAMSVHRSRMPDSHLYICEVGNYLIVQLKRFLVIDGVVSKYAAPVICTPYLDVPVRVDDEVSCVKKFAFFGSSVLLTVLSRISSRHSNCVQDL